MLNPHPRREPTAAQIRAVYAAMRILAEDDRERTGAAARVLCTACRRHRAAAGAVHYGAAHLCNGCATDYEVLRIGGVVEDVAAYLHRGAPALTGG